MTKMVKAGGIALGAGAVLLLAYLMPAGAGAGRQPRAALLPLTEQGHMQISPEDRCPMCGMFPAKRPKFAAAMVLSDGRTFYFCANGCLLRTWRDADRHLNVPADAIRRMVVLEFFSGEPLDAHDAWWVAGSDVIGPMGPALVALRTPRDVERFQARHGGETVFQLDQVDDRLWETLFAHRKRS